MARPAPGLPTGQPGLSGSIGGARGTSPCIDRPPATNPTRPTRLALTDGTPTKGVIIRPLTTSTVTTSGRTQGGLVSFIPSQRGGVEPTTRPSEVSYSYLPPSHGHRHSIPNLEESLQCPSDPIQLVRSESKTLWCAELWRQTQLGLCKATVKPVLARLSHKLKKVSSLCSPHLQHMGSWLDINLQNRKIKQVLHLQSCPTKLPLVQA